MDLVQIPENAAPGEVTITISNPALEKLQYEIVPQTITRELVDEAPPVKEE